MTASFFRKPGQAAVGLAFVVSTATLSAQPSFAYTAQAQQMCTGDAFRLCRAEIPNIPAITACMVKRRTELSSGCRAVMDRDSASGKMASE